MSYAITINGVNYALTSTTNDYVSTLSRTGAQGAKGDSIGSATIDSSGDFILTFVNGAGTTISTVNLGGSNFINSAQTAATNAAASFDSFDDRFLGAKSSAPTVDNDGDALLTGALFFNTTNSQLGVYNGSSFEYPALEASTSATNAATSETNAASSRTQAASSATSAATSEANASTSENNALSSKNSAATSATNAATSATNAAGSATAAASSSGAATTSASNAATSESNAATSASNASTSATNASNSASASSTSATNASNSASAAATSATASANSATAANSSENNAATSATNSATSAAAASGSAASAATSATNAASSESTALIHRNTAASSETNASNSATSAQSSANAAATAQAAAEAAFDNFDDKFLGTKTSDPTVDNDGNALVEGAMYYNSNDNVIKFYSGSSWSSPSVAASNSASAAATSATSASNSASAASTSETNASNSASSAATNATNAANSATSAAASFDSFDDIYLGAKSSAPSTDNDGDALQDGALYFNTTSDKIFVWNGSSFQVATGSIPGIQQEFVYTATAGQTSFSGSDDNSNTLVMDDADLVTVYLNGIKLTKTTDYTINLVTDAITFSSGRAVNDVVSVSVLGNLAASGVAITNPVLNGTATGTAIKDEDNMASDSATHLATQQSIKAYVDSQVASKDNTDEITEGSTNLYFTDARADARIAAANTGDLTEGSNLYFTNARAQAVSINNLVEDTTPQLGGHLGTNGYDVAFADDDKALFGAGSDLSIYHNSSNNHSYISEGGSGDLLITTNGSGIKLQKNTGENMIKALTDGAVSLYYDNQDVLSTTSSGVDVTGDAAITSGTDAKLTINDAIGEVGTGNLALQTTNSAGSALKPMGFRAEDIRFATGSSERVRIDSSGTLTTPSGVDFNIMSASGMTLGSTTSIVNFKTNNTEKMRIDASGNVLVGKQSSVYSTAGCELQQSGQATFTRSGSTPVSINRLSSDGNLLSFAKDSADVGQFGSNTTGGEVLLDLFATKNFRIVTNSSERMRIDSSGRVLIGQSSSTGSANADELVVGSGSGNQGITIFSGASNGSTLAFKDSGADEDGFISFNHGSQFMQFGTAASERMRIDSSGNVGIGTDSPAAPLHIQFSDNSGGVGGPLVKNTNTGTTSNFASMATQAVNGTINGTFGSAHYSTWGGATTFAGSQSNHPFRILTNNIVRASVDTSGRVGIGLQNPGDYYGNQLVVETPNEGGITMAGPTTGENYLMWADGTSGGERYRGYIGYSHTNNYMRFATGASERMRIDTNGRIHVGSQGGNSTAIIQGTSGAGYTNQPGTDLQLKGGAGGGTGGSNVRIFTAPGGSSGTSESAAEERVRIDNAGRVGIAQDTPGDFHSGADDLVIGNSSGGNRGITIRTGTGDNASIFFSDGVSGNQQYRGYIQYKHSSDAGLFFGTSGVDALVIDGSGNVLVGGTNTNPIGNHVPQVMLNGTGGSHFMRDDGVAVKVGRNDANECMEFFKQGASQGGISLTSSGVTYNSDSDYRLKENVTYTWDATTRLQQLKPAQFNFISVPDETMNGFLAHEVEAIVPDAVSGVKDAVDDDGNIKAQRIDHSRLVPLLVKTIQELEARITALEAG